MTLLVESLLARREWTMVMRCFFCERYFIPDHRVKERQKSCRRLGRLREALEKEEDDDKRRDGPDAFPPGKLLIVNALRQIREI
jgi:hypothetical protein